MNENLFRVSVVVLLVSILTMQVISTVLDERRVVTRLQLLAEKDPKTRQKMLNDLPMVSVRGSVDAHLNEPIDVRVRSIEQ